MAIQRSRQGVRLTSAVLLRYVEARVRRDRGPSGLAGTLCVGVRDGGRTSWWVGHFGPKTRTELVDRLPARYDAGIVVDATTARWILGAEASPGSLHLRTGDHALIDRFVQRYFGKLGMVAIRVGQRK